MGFSENKLTSLFISLMDFVLEDSEPSECVHYVHLGYERTGAEFYKKLGLFFIEIPKLTKGEKELKTDLDKEKLMVSRQYHGLIMS
jgi:hypothetical protein